MPMMVLVLNAVLYVIALSLSLAVLTPIPEGASRRVRVARGALACGGGLAMSVAITLSFMGHWFESGIRLRLDRHRQHVPVVRADDPLHAEDRRRRRR